MAHKKSGKMTETEQKEISQSAIFPALPPDYVFKNRQNIASPSMSVAEKYVTYLYDRVDYTEGQGIFTHYLGVDLPRKGIPFAQAVYSINSTKRLIIHIMKFLGSKELLFPFTKKNRIRLIEKALDSFNDTANMSMSPYFLMDGYYCKAAKEIRTFTTNFFCSLGVRYEIADKTGEVMAMIFEFDDAYRYRFQDIMSETDLECLVNDFPREIERLFELFAARENTGNDPKQFAGELVYTKFKNFARMLKILWWIPSIRKAIKAGFKSVNFKNWQLDEADIYHTLLYADYNVQGKTIEERIKTYLAMYGNDESKAPQRVEVRIK